MKNSNFIGQVIQCSECLHRYTEDCPMHVVVIPNGRYTDAYFIDKTEDNWFCSEGEEKNDA